VRMVFQRKPRFESKLFDEKNFYIQFFEDLNKRKNEVIVESPFITSLRIKLLYPVFQYIIEENNHPKVDQHKDVCLYCNWVIFIYWHKLELNTMNSLHYFRLVI